MLPLNILHLGWYGCRQLAAASLLTPTRAVNQHSVQHANYPCAPVFWNLQEIQPGQSKRILIPAFTRPSTHVCRCEIVMIIQPESFLLHFVITVSINFFLRIASLLDVVTAHARCCHWHAVWPRNECDKHSSSGKCIGEKGLLMDY